MTNQRTGAGDQVIYYRRPVGPDKEESGWIIIGDTLSGTKYRDYVRRGFQPLEKYGSVNTAGRDARAFGTKTTPAEEGWTPARYRWEQILSHPDGPGEFPVDQILTYRWYRPENLPIPGVVFPQLQGVKVKEYRCPERCGRPPFVDIDGTGGMRGLGSHLKIAHEWDTVALITYGERVGLDFLKADVAEFSAQEYIVEQAAAEFVCPHCKKPFRSRIALEGHKRSHPMVEVEAIG